MGRWKKSYIPVITEENKRIADEYMAVVSEHYEEYLNLFKNMYENGEDVVGETLLKTYKSIMCNGLKNIDIDNKEKKNKHISIISLSL